MITISTSRSENAILVRARQKAPMRGASVKARQQQRPRLRLNLKWVARGVAAAAIVAVLAGAGLAAEHLFNVPVSRVVVNGEFRQVDKNLISSKIEPLLGVGFLRLDLNQVRNQLRELPWVFDVQVSRSWPSEIVVAVEEQTPIARWGEEGFLNHRGELFVPERRHDEFLDVARLPALVGPEGSSKNVMNHYRELSEMLSQYGLVLSDLRLDDRGSWYAKLRNGTEMRLGDGEVMEKMRRFLSAYRFALADKFDSARAVDMRYSGGFAVSWKNQGVH